MLSRYYDTVDDERRAMVRSMQLMSDEARSLGVEIAEQGAAQLQVILDHIKDVVITANVDGMIDRANPMSERVFGYPPAELLGLRIDTLAPPAHRGRVLPSDHRARPHAHERAARAAPRERRPDHATACARASGSSASGQTVTEEMRAKMVALGQELQRRGAGGYWTPGVVGALLYNAIVLSVFWLLMVFYRRETYVGAARDGLLRRRSSRSSC